MKAKDLDAQSTVYISKWVEVDSDECRRLDDNRPFTKKCIRVLEETGNLVVDEQGRIWGRGDTYYYPLHIEVNGRNYGFKMAKKALN